MVQRMDEKEEALDLLDKIQDNAYEKYPDEEPDGDITYCHSITCEQF